MNTEMQFPNTSSKKKRRRKKHETILAVLSKLDTGESIENLAREYDCAPEAILRWKQRRDENPQHFKVSTPSVQSTTGTGAAGDPLARAMAALGTAPSSDAEAAQSAAHVGGDNGGEGSTQDTSPPFTEKPKFKAPDITAENLPMLIEGMDKMVMQGIAVAKGKGLPREHILPLMQMPEADKQTLAFFAPYAAEYAEEMLKYAKPVMAGLFVVFWGMSITSRAKDIAACAKQYKEWAEAQKGQHRAGEENAAGN